jgi:signal transduction histidine kinase
MRLFPKLLLSFLTVALVGVLGVSFFANLAAAQEVRRFVGSGGSGSRAGLVQTLGGYYRGHGSWEGVDVLLEHGHGMGAMMGQRVILADAAGRVIADTQGARLGQPLTSTEAASGLPVEVDGAQVGTLLVEGEMAMGEGGWMMGGQGFGRRTPLPGPEGDLLARVNRSVWLAALAAGGASLVVGGVLAYGLIRPIRRLTAATGAVAGGDLSQRVAAAPGDEIGELAASFNAMAAGLEKAESLRRDMTADIAHELRTPIAVLQGNLEGVIDGVLPATPENLQPLLDQTHLLARLVDDLRTLALADAGQLSLDRVPTDPAALARSVTAQYAAQAEAKQVALRAETAAGLPPARFDPQRISQVLGNLLANALRHTPEGGSVVCRVTGDEGQGPDSQRPPSHVTFTVSDSGPGMPPEALPYVFDRFYRAERSRSRHDGGAGLGLAIARKLVEAHGGRIWAESQPGQGAQVSFSLPVE